MLPSWQPVDIELPRMHIHKDNGRLYWNARVNQYLGNPRAVCLEYDEALNWLGVLSGNDFAVVLDEDGNFYIDALSALEECGLVFPLAENMVVSPDMPQNSHNRVIFQIG